MNFTNKTFVASYSGGKDSILALQRAIKQGMRPLALVITYNTDMGRSWFHGVPEAVLQEVAESLQIPVRLVRTSDRDYTENFKQELMKQKENGAQVCVFGDIDIEGHLKWGSDLCREVGLDPYFPLWQEPRESLVQEFIAEGFTANITVVDSARLSAKHLGKVLSEETLQEIAREGADICGENGEYHSFVSDGPIFARPIPFQFGEMVSQEAYRILPICKKDS